MKTIKDFVKHKDLKVKLIQTKVDQEMHKKTSLALTKLGWSWNDLIEAACRQAIDAAKK